MAKESPEQSNIPEVVRKFRVIFGQGMEGKQVSSLGVKLAFLFCMSVRLMWYV
jgi:hypothetical protein